MSNIKEKLVSYTSVLAFCSLGVLILPPSWNLINDDRSEALAITTLEVDELEDNKERARKFYEIWNAHNPDALDKVLAADYKMHSSLPGVTPDREGMKKWVGSVIAAFPDIHFTVEQQVAEGDLVMTRWSATGTHKGPMMGIPASNKKTKVTGISVVRLRDGLSVESWGEWDAMGMMTQIGGIPQRKAPKGSN